MQSFSKPSWTGNQGYIISIFPPFLDKIGFINIKILILY